MFYLFLVQFIKILLDLVLTLSSGFVKNVPVIKLENRFEVSKMTFILLLDHQKSEKKMRLFVMR